MDCLGLLRQHPHFKYGGPHPKRRKGERWSLFFVLSRKSLFSLASTLKSCLLPNRCEKMIVFLPFLPKKKIFVLLRLEIAIEKPIFQALVNRFNEQLNPSELGRERRQFNFRLSSFLSASQVNNFTGGYE